MTDRELLEDIAQRLFKIEGEIGNIPEVKAVRDAAAVYRAFCQQEAEAIKKGQKVPA
jgi:hypothetical protein